MDGTHYQSEISGPSTFYLPLDDAFAEEEVREGDAVFALKPRANNFSLSRPSSHNSVGDSAACGGGHSRRVHQLMAGSLETIVDCLATPDDTDVFVDSLHMNILLCTYPAFATAEQLLEVVFDRLRASCSSSSRSSSRRLRSALLVTLNAWLSEQYQEHFRQPPEFSALRRLCQLCDTSMAQPWPLVAEDEEEESGGSLVMEKLRVLRQLAERRLRTFRSQAAEASAAAAWQHSPKQVTWNELDELLVAEQLTRMDARLFGRVQLHECLGSWWGRHRRTGCSPSVHATVRQFNRVCNAVNWLLLEPGRSVQHRARTLCRWIRVAQYLRERRNFSSLLAIVHTLNSESVRRLRCVWSRLPAPELQLLKDFSRLCDTENNFAYTRRTIAAEATIKTADTKTFRRPSTISRQLSAGGHASQTVPHARKLSSLSFSEQTSGTIPYLGTSLTDLEGIHQAYPDTVHDGLLNFDKRRREYDILARLRLYQITCKQYQYPEDPRFTHWLLHTLPTVTEERIRAYSLAIQPQLRNDSFNEQCSTASDEPNSSCEGYKEVYVVLFKLQLPERAQPPTRGTSPAADLLAGMYKSVLVRPDDKTRKVIESVLQKYELSEPADSFLIVQVMADGKEKTLPDGSNVFYALNPRAELAADSDDSDTSGVAEQPRRLHCVLRHRHVQSEMQRRTRRPSILRLLPWMSR